MKINPRFKFSAKTLHAQLSRVVSRSKALSSKLFHWSWLCECFDVVEKNQLIFTANMEDEVFF